MPVELLLLFGLAGAGVLLSVAMLCVNMAMAQRARRLAPDPEELPAAEEAAEATQAPHAQAPEADGLPQTETRTARRRPERTQPSSRPWTAARAGPCWAACACSMDNAQENGTRADSRTPLPSPPWRSPACANPRRDGRGLRRHGRAGGGARAANTAAVQFMRAYLDAKAADGQALHQALLAANEKVFALGRGPRKGPLAPRWWPRPFPRTAFGSFRWATLISICIETTSSTSSTATITTTPSCWKRWRRATLSLEEARKHPERAHLTSYLGQREPALVDANAEPLALRAGDRVVLCSDGLFKTLPAAKMQQILSRCRQGAAQELVRAVMEAGKPRQDNVTAVVLYMDQV